jgi:tetratricopeptide (TPR) repeat protein
MIKALGNRAYIAEQLGRYDDAIKDLTDILAQDPDNLMAIKHLGFIHRQKGEPTKALRWFRMALKLEPSNAGRKRLDEEIANLQIRIRNN